MTSSPSDVVERFYEAAARHDYPTAWQLADENMRNQLEGYSSFRAQMSRVRGITFHQAHTLQQGTSSAAVAVATTAVMTDRTQHCTGTVETIRAAGSSWLLHHISIGCTAA